MNNKNLNRAGRRARASGRSSRWKKAIACLAAAALLGTAYPSEFLAETKDAQEETPAQENLPEITPSAEVSGTPTPAPQEEISGVGEETSHIHTEECYEAVWMRRFLLRMIFFSRFESSRMRQSRPAENSADEAEIDVTVLDLEFTCGGQPVDVSACEITAEITPSEKLQEEAETLEVSDEIADEAEIGIQLMALTANDAGETEEADSVTVEKGAEDVPKMAVALNAAEPQLQIVTRSALNPKFTVQYYANLEMTDRDSGGYLKIINTDNGGTNKGGNLPKNGESNPSMTGLYAVAELHRRISSGD